MPDSYIFEERFQTYDKALECVNKLMVDDRKITVMEEKIYTIS